MTVIFCDDQVERPPTEVLWRSECGKSVKYRVYSRRFRKGIQRWVWQSSVITTNAKDTETKNKQNKAYRTKVKRIKNLHAELLKVAKLITE